MGFISTLAQETIGMDKGAIILVYSKKRITTENLQEQDRVYFVNPADVWVGETNIIPKNSVFIGKISMLKMPVKGINAAMKIDITNIYLPNGETREFLGYVSTGSSDMIGGELTPPASYNKATHLYPSRLHWSGTAQWVPSGEYEFGQHRGINPNQNVYIILKEPYMTLKRQ